MPAGWNYFAYQGSNLQIVNSRLEIGQVDTAGGIYRPFNAAGVSQVTVSYDANVANNFWGGGTGASLTNIIANNSAGYIAASLGKSGYGQNSMGYQLQYGTPTVAPTLVLSNVVAPAYGDYHITSTFQDGYVSISATPFGASLPIYSSGPVAAPSFLLSRMHNLTLYGVTTTGTSGWIDNVKITTTTAAAPPTALELAKLSLDVKSSNPQGVPGSFNLVPTPTPNPYGFKANLYTNNADPHQYVIAVLDTNPKNKYDLVADSSFLSPGNPNIALTDYAKALAAMVASVKAQDPYANITLTGHSLGGAVAQLVGGIAGLPVTSFDAPGINGEMTVGMRNAIVGALGSTALGNNATPSAIVNYRLYGDQISFAGTNLPGLTTITVDNVKSSLQVDKELLPMGWRDNHDMATLETQMEKLCTSSPVVGCVNATTTNPGGTAPGANIVGTIIRGAVLAAPVMCLFGNQGYCALAAIANGYIESVIAKVLNPHDPGPGNAYSLSEAAGSPFIRSLGLPIFNQIFGWDVKYHDENGWSVDDIMMGDGNFNFTSDVDGLTFVPLGADGNPVFNPDYFVYDLSFASDGQFVATQVSYGATVPEPNALLLFAISGFALIFVQRRRRKSETLWH